MVNRTLRLGHKRTILLVALLLIVSTAQAQYTHFKPFQSRVDSTAVWDEDSLIIVTIWTDSVVAITKYVDSNGNGIANQGAYPLILPKLDSFATHMEWYEFITGLLQLPDVTRVYRKLKIYHHRRREH